MKVFFFGATSPTGKMVLEKLLAENYTVTSVVRNPDTVSFRHQNLTIIKGDVLNPSSFEERIKGNNIVISIIGTGSIRQAGKTFWTQCEKQLSINSSL